MATTAQSPAMPMVRDPVCGMELEAGRAHATRTRGGVTLYLCSSACLAMFDAAPERYLPTAGPGAR